MLYNKTLNYCSLGKTDVSFVSSHQVYILLNLQIDGQTNPSIQSIHVKNFPIHTAHFSADGEQVIMASRRPFFYVYDMIKGEVTRIPGVRGR